MNEAETLARLSATNKPHRCQPKAIRVQRTACSGYDVGVVTETKIVVGTKVEHRAMTPQHACLCARQDAWEASTPVSACTDILQPYQQHAATQLLDTCPLPMLAAWGVVISRSTLYVPAARIPASSSAALALSASPLARQGSAGTQALVLPCSKRPSGVFISITEEVNSPARATVTRSMAFLWADSYLGGSASCRDTPR